MRAELASMAVCLALAGCAAAPPAVVPPDARLPIASRLDSVHDDMARATDMKESPVLSGLPDPSKESVLFKPPVVMQTLADPWRGIEQLERRLLRVAVAPLRDHPVPELITALHDLPDRSVVLSALPTPPSSMKPDDHLAYLETVLVEADKLRERALEGLNESERQFLFDHAALLAEQFVPQLSEQNEDQQFRARMHNRFFSLIVERLDETAMLTSAQLVASLADDAWLQAAQTAFARLPPVSPSSAPSTEYRSSGVRLMNATHRPSGLTTGVETPSFIDASVRVSPGASMLSACRVASCLRSARRLVNSSVRPSGDHVGWPSRSPPVTGRGALLPSVAASHTCER